MSATTTFDLARFTRATEERDAATQLSMYSPDATVTIVDKITQPSSPRVLRTHEEVKDWLEDTAGRDLTHSVEQMVSDELGAAFTLACRYPDGTRVLCLTLIKLADSQVTDQTVVQIWDEK